MSKHPQLVIVFSFFLIVALFGVARSYYVINPARCDGCGTCVSFCPNNAIYYDQSLDIMRIDNQLCDGCGNCLPYCPHSAIDLSDSTGCIMGNVSAADTSFPIRNAQIATDSFYCTSGLWGDFCLNLPAGIYTLTCSAEGYIDQIEYDLELNTEQIIRQDFSLYAAGSDDNMELAEFDPEGYFSPNPFHSETTFYQHPKAVTEEFDLEIYNLKGQRIGTLTSSERILKNIPAGIYLYKYSDRQKTYSGKLTCLPD